MKHQAATFKHYHNQKKPDSSKQSGFALLQISTLTLLGLLQSACFARVHHETMESKDSKTTYGSTEFYVYTRASRYDLAKSWAPWSLSFDTYDESLPAKEFTIRDITVEIEGKTYSYPSTVDGKSHGSGSGFASGETGPFIPLPESDSAEATVRFRASIKGRHPVQFHRKVRFQIETETGITWFNPLFDIT